MLAFSRLPTTPLSLPESVAWLERLTFAMTTSFNSWHGLGKHNVMYELTLTYQPSKDKTTTWTLSHSFEKYRELRRRLVKALRPGHRCNAECKWLGNVIKHHFPKASVFRKDCLSGVEGTRVALLKMLNTIKASLVNYGNLGCSRMHTDVSKVFTTFLSRSLSNDSSTILSPSPSSLLLSPTTFHPSSLSTSDDENRDISFVFDDFLCEKFARCKYRAYSLSK